MSDYDATAPTWIRGYDGCWKPSSQVLQVRWVQCPATYTSKWTKATYFCVEKEGHTGPHKATHGRWKRGSSGRQ